MAHIILLTIYKTGMLPADSSIKDSCLDDSNKWSDESSSNTEPSLEESEANLDAALLLGGPYRGAGKKVRNYA